MRLRAFIAARKNATTAQAAIAWLLAQRAFIVPIPGTRKRARLVENNGAVELHLDANDLAEIRSAAEKLKLTGERGTGHEVYR
jgi:aryl-alcohol dehydrogenase-like predicted oxidoreductase